MLSPDVNNAKTAKSASLEKDPKLQPGLDYYFLRRKAIGFIEEMGSRWWTDYNTHDPGITILEALCYALTDIGYRADWDIKDIVAEPVGTPLQPERQAFYTARDILTVNPLTISDYRRILIDLDKVANAWLIAKRCGCETHWYADCEHERLTFSQPDQASQKPKIGAKGSYDILLELDNDPELGDLNDRKIQHTFIVELDEKKQAVTMEFYFPAWEKAAWGPVFGYLSDDGQWLKKIDGIQFKAALSKSGQDGDLTHEEKNRRWRQWQRVFFADINLTFADASFIRLPDVPFKLFGNSEVRQRFKEDWELSGLIDFKPAFIGGVAELYIKKIATVERTLRSVRHHLSDHRNLCEDFCSLSTVCVEDVAVCADIEVTTDADIEQVLANVLFAIEQYFNPGIRFYFVQELMAEGIPTDEIFDGPQLDHGFIKPADLEAAQLKSQLRTSDIVNQLVEIKGVIAIKSLQLTRYNQDGQAIAGAADIGQNHDQNKTSASWTLEISERCLPRLHVASSKFIFFKNELPFIPRASEVQDTLSQLRGQDQRLKIRNLKPEELDLPVPAGQYRPLTEYFPIQNAFPLTYGIGQEGLPAPSTKQRRAQAKQLKGYLMCFEQLLSNALAQIANVKNLFALDENQVNSYFAGHLRNEALIRDCDQLFKAELTAEVLHGLLETEAERLDRRNRFLDHLMARFAESFADYAMTLHAIESDIKPVTQANLITQKVAFLKSYPEISRNRAKSFNYQLPQDQGNQPIIRQRIALLLGMPPTMADRIIVVEHLLLRPKFPGDALLPVCLETPCGQCNEQADPYSFQMTLVMPGWEQPFADNLELRRFADRTIQLELPAHLLAKICWVSNLDYGEDWQPGMLNALASYLQKNGKTTDSTPPSHANAADGAEKLLTAAQQSFVDWFNSTPDKATNEFELKSAIIDQLKLVMADLTNIYPDIKNYDEIGDTILDMLADYYSRIALADRWFHYLHFKVAWENWLAANREFVWADENVVRKIELALIELGISQSNSQSGARRASGLAEQFGAEFSEQMEQNVRQDIDFPAPDARKAEVLRIFQLAFADNGLEALDIAQPHADALSAAFANIYLPYFDVTIKLWKVLLSLAKLRSVYPPATLHDCDDSNDVNPVRLGSTQLGG